MDSLRLAAKCYSKGLMSKEATAEVLAIRERLIKEAIARKVSTGFFGKARRGTEGFMADLKQGLLSGGQTRMREGKTDVGLGWGHAVGNLIKLLAGGAALGAGAAGVSGLAMHRKDKKLKGQIEQSFGKMIEEYPRLQEADRGKVSRHFGVLARYAPSLAADPMVAGSWVKQTVGMGHIDPDMIKRLSDTQTSIDRAHEERSVIKPGQFGKGIQLAQTAMG